MKFTQNAVLRLRPPANVADHFEPDESLPGFGIRFRNGGDGTYCIRFSIGGRDGRQSYKRVLTVTLADAREWAKRQHAGIAEKIDPAVTRARAIAKTSNTLDQLIDGYLTFLTVNGRTEGYVIENARSLQRYLKALHRFSVNDINRQMVAAELARIRQERGPIAGNHVRAHLSGFYGWAIREGLAEANPVAGTSKAKAKPRERVLLDAELAAIWQALGDDDYGAIIKLLVLTGARRDEIGSLGRTEINVGLRRLELPAARTKNKRPHLIPMSPLAWSILEPFCLPSSRPFVFGRGDGGFSGWSKSKARLDARLSLEPWTLHDFRRGVSTAMHERLGIDPHVVEAVLNHVSGHRAGIAGTYNRAAYLDQKRDALDKWAAYVADLIAK